MGALGQPTVEAPPLFEHGIFEENSDIRAHVSPFEKRVYVFPTRNGIEAIKRHSPRLGKATQNGVNGVTAEGWLVRIEWVEDMRTLRFESYPKWSEFSEAMSTSQKGKFAVQCVVELMRRGRFPIWMDAEEDKRQDVQIKGTDILLFCKKRIQVKCDAPAGRTGNLFLQKSECNPLRRT